MDRKQRLKLELARDRADTWAKQYDRIVAKRDQIRDLAAKAVATFRNATFSVTVDGVPYRLLLLNAGSLKALNDLARYVQLPPFSADDKEQLQQLDKEIPVAIRDVVPIVEPKLASRRSAADAEEAAEFLLDYVSWGLSDGIEQTLARITPQEHPDSTLADALQPAVGLRGVLNAYGTPELLPITALTNPLATFTAAQKFPELARTINNQHEYAVVCAPPNHSAQDLVRALEAAEA